MKGAPVSLDLLLSRTYEIRRVQVRNQFSFTEKCDAIAKKERLVQVVRYQENRFLETP
jgi:hypothetical protein